jgi:hypothetical protein
MVRKKTILKLNLLDLCCNVSWAINAPDQPPSIDKKCKVFSDILQLPSCA